jgi:long-chain-fatty-acid--CoA ligase ACSBG
VGIVSKNYVYFARPDALSGSLLETIRQVKPSAFFAVPRVFEKFQERIKEVLDKTAGLKKKIGIYIN